MYLCPETKTGQVAAEISTQFWGFFYKCCLNQYIPKLDTIITARLDGTKTKTP